ncbi:MAG: tetratricopeptide repeat protein [Phycisphaerales bacterium]
MNPKIHLAQEHVRSGRFAQAKPLLLAVLQQRPDDFDALALLTDALIKLHELPQAEYYARRALRGREHIADAWTILTMWQVAAGKFADAEHSARHAMDLDPTNPERYRHAAAVHVRLNQYGKMAVAAAAGAAISPQDDDLHLKHAVALLNLGQVELAADVYRAGSALCPKSLALAEGLATGLNYVPGVSIDESIEAHRRFGHLLAEQSPAHPAPVPAAGQPRLRVGILSPDLRRHSVAYFARPILQHLPRDRFELHIYSTTNEEDAESAGLRTLLADDPHAAWRTFPKADAAAVAGTIRDDRIDILVELSGLMAGHNQRVMIRRPAPVQVSYMGYPSITGVPTIDARLVDALTDPPETEPTAAGLERLVRLAGCFLCYAPPADPPPVAPPQNRDGRIVFGSFNTLRKVNEALLALWGRVLDAVPGSTLLIKTAGLDQAEVCESVNIRLRRAGIDPGRVELRGPTTGLGAHLAEYAGMDIALDTFPYCGTTTTCEALLMGVPVVSKVGSVHASRVGLSLLSAVGVPGLLATSDDAYVALAASLAHDRARLNAMRGTLRPQLLASTLCDGGAFGERLGTALSGLAGRLCDQKPNN